MATAKKKKALLATQGGGFSGGAGRAYAPTKAPALVSGGKVDFSYIPPRAPISYGPGAALTDAASLRDGYVRFVTYLGGPESASLEAISKTQTLLLTFKGIRNEVGKGNDVYNQASTATLDLSKRFGKDLNGSAILVGKALNDPIKGLTALQRIGVGFTKDQQKQIKALVASGDVMGAQKIILGELSDQTKGAAAATATNTDRLKVSWGNVEEAIGSGLYPVVQKAAGALNDLATESEPIIGRTAKDVSRILGNGLTGQNLSKALFVGRRDLRPLTRSVEDALGDLDAAGTIKRWHLDDKLQEAFVAATPRIADAVAASAPRVASSFANAFVNAGPGGQLITVALLASKLGAFGAVGPILGGRFGRGFTRSATPPIVNGLAMNGSGGKGISGAMGKLGKASGALFGAYAAFEIGHSLSGAIPSLEQYFNKDGSFNLDFALNQAPKFLDPTNLGTAIGKDATTAHPKLSPTQGRVTLPKAPARPKGQLINHRGTPRSSSRGIGFTIHTPIQVVTANGAVLAETVAATSVKKRERGG